MMTQPPKPPPLKPLPRLTTALAGLILLGASMSGQAQGFRAEMERAYQGFKSSIITKNYPMFERYTASHRVAQTHNMVVSRKDKWPDAMFNIPFQLPEIGALTYLTTLEVGRTANMVYFGKVDFGVLDPGVEIPENILLLCFVQEGNDWKFDRTRFFNLGQEPGIRHLAKTRDLSFLNDPVFRPTGEVPEVPEKIQPPDYVGEMFIASVGYETTIQLGDLHESYVNDGIITDVVIGGLSKAGKDITITVKPVELPDDVEPRLEIEVWALRPGKPATRVWMYKPDLSAEVPETHKGKVWANAVTIRGG